jgi:hypothetical protein
MAVNTTKKKSFKNRVKGFFSKVGSRFSRKKNAQQANKNFTKSIDVDELNQQTKELKNLLQRQVENAGNLNMDTDTKQVVQNNIETTRKLIEARQQELTNRGEKEKLEQLKKNIESVGNVVEKAPSSANGNRLGNVSNLKVAAVNALKRMSGMDSVAAQIEALRNVIKECCKDGAGCGRNRSGSVSSVNSNNRGAANQENTAMNAVPPSPAGLFGSNNFENEPSKPSKSGLLSKPTMNNLTADEKERVRLFKNLNSSITNNNALNLIRQEREQTASRNTKKGGRRNKSSVRSKKRSVSRKKNNRK